MTPPAPSTGVHTFGLCATALITNILQLMTGSPAPYFLSVCKPNYSSLDPSCEQNPHVTEDICTGADQAAISQGRWGLSALPLFFRVTWWSQERTLHTHTCALSHAHTCTLTLAESGGGTQRLEEAEVGQDAGDESREEEVGQRFCFIMQQSREAARVCASVCVC